VFTAQSGAVTFDGSVTQTLDTDVITFYDLEVGNGIVLITSHATNSTSVTASVTIGDASACQPRLL